ncbi:unnamed protein product [Effrenium voratum]|nr:unnamed protein product [Effrenium voratum]
MMCRWAWLSCCEPTRRSLLERLDAWLRCLELRLMSPAPCEGVSMGSPAPDSPPGSILGLPRNISIRLERGDRTEERKDVSEALEEEDSMGDGVSSYDLARMAHDRMVVQQQEDDADTLPQQQNTQSAWAKFRQFAIDVVSSSNCNAFFAMVVLTNSIYLGVQLEYHSVAQDAKADGVFLAVHLCYALIFTLEVLLRLVADGPWQYFWSADWAWNLLDIFVVTSSWVELVIDALTPGHPDSPNRGTNSNLRLMRLLRVGRLFRVVRIIRVVRLFRSLRTLVQSLVGTLKSLFWAMLLLFLIMYIFAILFTDAVLNHVVSHKNEASLGQSEADAVKFFGTLHDAVLTLFQTISDGLTWNVPASALASIELGGTWVTLFYFYVAFCSFAVLNVMTTGVFCNSAIKAAESDHEMVVQSLVQTRMELKDLVSNLFYKIDKRGQGQITFTEFEKFFEDESVKAFFESLQIGAMDAWTLFVSLDMDGDHTISVEEFTERCLQLHGPARSADLFALRQQSSKISKQLQKLESRLQRQRADSSAT